jgi:hypothetical protein
MGLLCVGTGMGAEKTTIYKTRLLPGVQSLLGKADIKLKGLKGQKGKEVKKQCG